MSFDPLKPLPFLTSGLSGIGGRIKQQPEDFEVEEIPAYEPSGQGDFLYLWIEKRDMGAEYFSRQVARRLGLHPEDVGMAGLKDRRAITRQWVSVPASAEDRLTDLPGDGIHLLQVSRHNNKLKPGHLRGNRFRIRIRDAEPAGMEHLEKLLDHIRGKGLVNFYGPQRFGRSGETVQMGMRLLQGKESFKGGRFLRKLALSAAQSALFNDYLVRRTEDGLLHRIVAGDVMAKWPVGGLFVATDMDVEQARFERRETVHTGPIFGRKMFAAGGQAAERELAVLHDAGLTPDAFHGFGKLLQGTRRHNLIYVDDLSGTIEGSDVLLSFTLPAGSYATMLLREIMKSESAEEGEAL